MKAWGLVHRSLCTFRVLSQYKRKPQSKTLSRIHCSLHSQWLNFFQSVDLNVWRRGCRSHLFDWINFIFHKIQNFMQVKIYFWPLGFFGYRLFGQIQLWTKRKPPNQFNLQMEIHWHFILHLTYPTKDNNRMAKLLLPVTNKCSFYFLIISGYGVTEGNGNRWAVEWFMIHQ